MRLTRPAHGVAGRGVGPFPRVCRGWWRTALCAGVLVLASATATAQDWFETFKDTATPAELHRFLHAMPKGGDLHLHLGGSVFSEWYFDLAIEQAANGYRYFTKVRIENCADAAPPPRRPPYLFRFHTVDQHTLERFSACERSEYVPLASLTGQTKAAWLDSLRLDKAHEGRNEFFEAHWARLGDLTRNPYLVAEALYRNMAAFGEEGVAYIEPQVAVQGLRTAAGEALEPDAVMDIYRQRIARPDAQATGVTVRMQLSLLRFRPDAEAQLERLYDIAARHKEIVAVNMVGREDNDKGYPLRFLDTLRALRLQRSGVRLAIHAGEVDEPNHHVRDTLLLGAERIGHGLNLITDPQTLTAMRHGPYMVEINLISNLLLEYVDDYAQHPFPEYLRIGVPVALSTDDRGMWDSTLTDEFFVAVTEYDLTWQEIERLSRNSLRHSFLEEAEKAALLNDYTRRIEQFVASFRAEGMDAFADRRPPRRGFICRRYGLCP